jgi:hypothetical protein
MSIFIILLSFNHDSLFKNFFTGRILGWRIRKKIIVMGVKPPLFTKPFKKPADLFFISKTELSFLFFSCNNQVATDDAEGSVILHPSYLVWLESLGGQWTVDDVGEFPSGSL